MATKTKSKRAVKPSNSESITDDSVAEALKAVMADRDSSMSARVGIDTEGWVSVDLCIECIPATSLSDSPPLVVHRFSEKRRRQMREKQMGIKASGKEAKQPVDLMKDTLYRFPEEVNGTIFGVPAVGLKKATVRAFKGMDNFTMVDAKGFFHICGKKDEEETTDLIPVIAPPITELNFKEKLLAKVLKWTEEEMKEALKVEHKYGACLREDDVRGGQGTADIRYRGAFPTWRIPFTVEYNPSAVSLQQLCTAIDRGGRGVGICENRPEKSGDRWGTYQMVLNQ